ncbi:MAG: acetyl-CoA hydrolase/transferase family protein [Candidatus Marinimicrobia bacterium]|nr:acetyl-CoA hydrolase/transferase family protein [Candidatus Neomarinimicrobiota bacterium]
MLDKAKVMTAAEAVSVINSNDRVFIQGGAVVPKQLIQAMVKRHHELRNVRLYHILTMGTTEETAPYTLPGMEKSFIHHAFFVGKNTRRAMNDGRAYYMPVFLSEVSDYFDKEKLDVAFLQISPPDSRGYCSLGLSVDITRSGYKNAKTVIAEINPNVPRTQGYSFIHLDEINKVVEVDYPLFEAPRSEPNDVQKKIGKHIAELIPDEACLQVGIGTIPDATLSLLENHKNLNVHSELISDGIMELVEKGVITNTTKTLNVGKVVTGIVMGSKDLYDWTHNNPILEMRPSSYTNDIFNISRNDNVIAINQALSIDFKGQVAADSIGRKFYSGIGGQVDFIRGAARSKGGKPIIALPSTAKVKGKLVSRITPFLEQGGGVVTSEGDVHYVVTEYGVAMLHHRGMGERAKQLIRIAHPAFREELEKTARSSGFKLD